MQISSQIVKSDRLGLEIVQNVSYVFIRLNIIMKIILRSNHIDQAVIQILYIIIALFHLFVCFRLSLTTIDLG